MTFGERLRALRVQAGLTQHELADGIVADSYVSLLESDKRSPGPDLVKKLAERLGVSAASLDELAGAGGPAWELNAGRIALARGDAEEALQYAQSVIQRSGDDSETQVAGQVLRVQALAKQGAAEQVIDLCEQLLTQFPRASAQHRSALAVEMVRWHYRLGNLNQGADRGEAMLREATLADWPPSVLIDLYCTTATCQLHRGDGQRAAALARKAVDLAEQMQEPRALMHAYWEAAAIAQAAGLAEEAVRRMELAVHWCELSEFVESLPRIRGVLAALLVELPSPELERAKDLAEAAMLDLAVQRNPVSVAFSHLTLANVALRNQDATTALDHARRGLQELGPDLQGPRIELIIAQARAEFITAGSLDALWAAAEAVGQLAGHGQQRDVSAFWVEIARLSTEAGDLRAATKAYERVIDLQRAQLGLLDFASTHSE